MAGFHPADPGSSPGYGTSWISESPASKHSILPCWRSWIARTPSKREVTGSSPVQGISGPVVQWLTRLTLNQLTGVQFPAGPYQLFGSANASEKVEQKKFVVVEKLLFPFLQQ